MINVTKTFLPPIEEYNKQVQRAWDNEWLTNRGELVLELEEKLKKYLPVSNIIATNNGTVPLQIALKLLGDKGEIITTPFSYVATTAAIVWENCTPVFVDIHPEYLTIDETKIEQAITAKTRAILATHVFGNPCNVEVIEKIAEKYNLKVIYDAAHAFGVTYKGKSILNGFQVGKRTSDKIIRCYNKTLSLQLTEKPYINDYYANNGLKNENVWRFEYQLNSAFFRGLNEHSKADTNISQSMTWGIFDKANLYELLKIANKGFFELRENTGKSQINKEKLFMLFDFDFLQSQITKFNPIIKRLKKVVLSTTTIKKRLAKSLFREYYSNNQDISYIVALNLLLEDLDMITEKPLINWFNSKLHFYLHEFRTKEKLVNHFDFELFHEHQFLFL